MPVANALVANATLAGWTGLANTTDARSTCAAGVAGTRGCTTAHCVDDQTRAARPAPPWTPPGGSAAAAASTTSSTPPSASAVLVAHILEGFGSVATRSEERRAEEGCEGGAAGTFSRQETGKCIELIAVHKAPYTR